MEALRKRFKKLLDQYLSYINDKVSPNNPMVIEGLQELSKINSEHPEIAESHVKEMADITKAAYASPYYKNFQTMKEVLGAVEGGIDLFNTFANLSTAHRQIQQAEDAANELQQPAIPSLTPKNEALKEATLDARLQSRGRIREIDPIIQQNLNLLRKGLGAAKTASAGQAGIYGSLGQAAINQAHQANIAAIPAIERIKRQRDSRYDSLVATGIQENFALSDERRSIFGLEEDRYNKEAIAIGQLGAAGNYNLAVQRQNIGGVFAETLQPLASGILNTMRFNKNQTDSIVGSQYTTNNPNGGIQYGNINSSLSSLLPQVNYNSLSNINSKYDSILRNTNDSLAGYFTSKN